MVSKLMFIFLNHIFIHYFWFIADLFYSWGLLSPNLRLAIMLLWLLYFFLIEPSFYFKSNYNFSFPAQLFWAHFVLRGICWRGIVASYCSTHSLYLMPATALSYKTSTDITRYFQKHYPWHSLHLFYIHGYSFKSRFSGKDICVGLNWNCS